MRLPAQPETSGAFCGCFSGFWILGKRYKNNKKSNARMRDPKSARGSARLKQGLSVPWHCTCCKLLLRAPRIEYPSIAALMISGLATRRIVSREEAKEP